MIELIKQFDETTQWSFHGIYVLKNKILVEFKNILSYLVLQNLIQKTVLVFFLTVFINSLHVFKTLKIFVLNIHVNNISSLVWDPILSLFNVKL